MSTDMGPDPLSPDERRVILRGHLEREKSRRRVAEARLAEVRETVTTFRTHYAATLGDRAADLACAVLQVLDRDEMGSGEGPGNG